MTTRSVVGTGRDWAANWLAICSEVRSSATAAVNAKTAASIDPNLMQARMDRHPLTSGAFFTTTLRMQPVHIVGGGLAGCEAASYMRY
jgi:hypothetical protein